MIHKCYLLYFFTDKVELMTILGIMTSLTGKNVSGNTHQLTVQSYTSEQDNCKGRWVFE